MLITTSFEEERETVEQQITKNKNVDTCMTQKGDENTFNFFPVGFEGIIGACAGVDNIEGAVSRGNDIGVRTIT